MTEQNNSIVIVGSVNMDLVVRTAHVPAPGETLLGRDFATIPGGKGANQAVAVARLGGHAIMVGRVGDDDFGQRLRTGLTENGVDCTHLLTTPDTPSGIAMIVVGDDGENAITVASGANFAVTPADVDAASDAIRAAKVCLLQLELPVETVAYTIDLCRRHGVETILDTAPVPPDGIPDELYQADILSPNETEAALLTGREPATDPARITRDLHKRGCKTLILKLGQRGAYLSEPGNEAAIPGYSIDPVDTTAAGDGFTGALAVGRARGWDLRQTIRFANATGALACTRMGAQPSMPVEADVETLINSQAPGGPA